MLLSLRRHAWRILAAVLVIAGAGVMLFLKGRTASTAANASTNINVNYESLGDVVFPVEVDTVRRGTLTKFITANGSIRAAQSVDIVARASGFIEMIPPPNGSSVGKGQTLVRFDSREALLALKEADDKRVQAQVEFGLSFRETNDTSASARALVQARQEQVATATKRINTELATLNEQRSAGRISAKDYADRKTTLEAELLYAGAQRATVMQSKSGLSAAKNAVEKAQLMLEYCKVQSPFAGVVANVQVASGQYVQAGQTLCKVLDVSSLLVDVGVLETELPFVRVGTSAEATFQALPGATLRGTVIAINPLADPASKTYTVTIRLASSTTSQRIAPSMFATVRLTAEELRNRILLPRAALLSRDKRNVVFSLVASSGASSTPDKSEAQWNYVETGAANDRFVEITGGLDAGTVVMTEGHFTLAHGAAVRVVEKKGANAANAAKKTAKQ
jgi:RND family efflux transporter MFP subunit